MPTASKVGIRGIDTTSYLVKDVARATRFYTDLLGFDPTLSYLPIGVEWTFPTGETFSIVKPPNAPWEKGGGVHFGVEDVKAAVAACKASGIAFEDDKIYETPGCFLAFALDSEGNEFILHQLKPR